MKTTMRTALRLAVAATTVVGLAACGSSTSSDSSPAPETTAPAAAGTTAVADAPVPTTCPQFTMTAGHMATYWHYLNLAQGTTNDEGPTLANLSAGIAAMQDLAPTCAPQAVESIDAFAQTVEAIQPIYVTQPTGDQVQQVGDALTAMQKAGVAMYADLDQPDYSWR